jgi:hypothetical protein
VNDSNEANELPGPAHNWWPTAEEADMHRTDLEAQEVIHHARSWKNEVNLAMIDGEPLPIESSTVNEKTGEVTVEDTNKPVRYSVQAEEVLKRGGLSLTNAAGAAERTSPSSAAPTRLSALARSAGGTP